MSAGRAEFLARLLGECGGEVRFDRWMGEALFHPEFGYYSKAIRDIGARGDFSTWPRMDGSLARAIFRWAREAGRDCPLIEVGAGTGELAAGILKEAGFWRRPRYWIAEISPVLRAEQKRRLGKSARWFESLRQALAESGGRANIFSNELADAFPCRIFRKGESGWDELFIGVRDGRPAELWRLPESLPDSAAFECRWPLGQRVEVHESFRDFLASAKWGAGRMLVIDYGGPCPDLYRRRPRGTLRAYARQQRFEGPDALLGFGLRDLTADVNFTDLGRWAKALGWEVAREETLLSFLVRRGQSVSPEMEEAAGQFRVAEFVAREPG